MKGLGYFEKLSLAARWFLPREEAQGMEEDYRDILMEVEGPEEAVKRFGTPVRLARGLADGKKVRRWHFFFLMLLFLVVMPCVLYFTAYRKGVIRSGANNLVLCGALFFVGLWIISIGSFHKRAASVLTVLLTAFVSILYCYNLYDFFERTYRNATNQWTGYVGILPYEYELPSFFLMAALLSLAVFGLNKRQKEKVPRFLVVSLCLVALGVAGVLGFCLYGAYVDVGLMLHLGWVKAGSLCVGGLCFLGALFSLVMARLRDRRWRAVVILCLAGFAMCIELHYLVWNCSASLWVLVRDYEAGNADWVISNIQNVTYRFLIYAGSGSVLAAIGLI